MPHCCATANTVAPDDTPEDRLRHLLFCVHRDLTALVHRTLSLTAAGLLAGRQLSSQV